MQVANSMDKDENDSSVVVKRLSVPLGLEELMESLTKQVLQKKPRDIYSFASDHFAKLLEIRDKSSARSQRDSSLTTPPKAITLSKSQANALAYKSALFASIPQRAAAHQQSPKRRPRGRRYDEVRHETGLDPAVHQQARAARPGRLATPTAPVAGRPGDGPSPRGGRPSGSGGGKPPDGRQLQTGGGRKARAARAADGRGDGGQSDESSLQASARRSSTERRKQYDKELHNLRLRRSQIHSSEESIAKSDNSESKQSNGKQKPAELSNNRKSRARPTRAPTLKQTESFEVLDDDIFVDGNNIPLAQNTSKKSKRKIEQGLVDGAAMIVPHLVLKELVDENGDGHGRNNKTDSSETNKSDESFEGDNKDFAGNEESQVSELSSLVEGFDRALSQSEEDASIMENEIANAKNEILVQDLTKLESTAKTDVDKLETTVETDTDFKNVETSDRNAAEIVTNKLQTSTEAAIETIEEVDSKVDALKDELNAFKVKFADDLSKEVEEKNVVLDNLVDNLDENIVKTGTLAAATLQDLNEEKVRIVNEVIEKVEQGNLIIDKLGENLSSNIKNEAVTIKDDLIECKENAADNVINIVKDATLEEVNKDITEIVDENIVDGNVLIVKGSDTLNLGMPSIEIKENISEISGISDNSDKTLKLKSGISNDDTIAIDELDKSKHKDSLNNQDKIEMVIEEKLIAKAGGNFETIAGHNIANKDKISVDALKFRDLSNTPVSELKPDQISPRNDKDESNVSLVTATVVNSAKNIITGSLAAVDEEIAKVLLEYNELQTTQHFLNKEVGNYNSEKSDVEYTYIPLRDYSLEKDDESLEKEIIKETNISKTKEDLVNVVEVHNAPHLEVLKDNMTNVKDSALSNSEAKIQEDIKNVRDEIGHGLRLADQSTNNVIEIVEDETKMNIDQIQENAHKGITNLNEATNKISEKIECNVANIKEIRHESSNELKKLSDTIDTNIDKVEDTIDKLENLDTSVPIEKLEINPIIQDSFFGKEVSPRVVHEECLVTKSNRAATQIQSAWRGHRIRKSLSRKHLQRPEECDELPEYRFVAEDTLRAAITIQAFLRGHLVRKALRDGSSNVIDSPEKCHILEEILEEPEVEVLAENDNMLKAVLVPVVEVDLMDNFEKNGDEIKAKLEEKEKVTLTDEEVHEALKQLDAVELPKDVEIISRNGKITKGFSIDNERIIEKQRNKRSISSGNVLSGAIINNVTDFKKELSNNFSVHLDGGDDKKENFPDDLQNEVSNHTIITEDAVIIENVDLLQIVPRDEIRDSVVNDETIKDGLTSEISDVSKLIGKDIISAEENVAQSKDLKEEKVKSDNITIISQEEVAEPNESNDEKIMSAIVTTAPGDVKNVETKDSLIILDSPYKDDKILQYESAPTRPLTSENMEGTDSKIIDTQLLKKSLEIAEDSVDDNDLKLHIDDDSNILLDSPRKDGDLTNRSYDEDVSIESQESVSTVIMAKDFSDRKTPESDVDNTLDEVDDSMLDIRESLNDMIHNSIPISPLPMDINEKLSRYNDLNVRHDLDNTEYIESIGTIDIDSADLERNLKNALEHENNNTIIIHNENSPNLTEEKNIKILTDIISAATKIQSLYRGYKVRAKSYTKTNGKANIGIVIDAPENNNTDDHEDKNKIYDDVIAKIEAEQYEELEKISGRPHSGQIEDELKDSAAIMIQKHYKGYRIRRDLSSQEAIDNAEKLDHINNQEQENAALTIQKHYKGFKTRKELYDKGANIVSTDIGIKKESIMQIEAEKGEDQDNTKMEKGDTKVIDDNKEDNAAKTIQKQFKVYKSRKELSEKAIASEPDNNITSSTNDDKITDLVNNQTQVQINEGNNKDDQKSERADQNESKDTSSKKKEDEDETERNNKALENHTSNEEDTAQFEQAKNNEGILETNKYNIEEENAATTIQKHYKSFKDRKDSSVKNENKKKPETIQNDGNNEKEIKEDDKTTQEDIALEENIVNDINNLKEENAAMAIQKHYRTFKERKELDKHEKTTKTEHNDELKADSVKTADNLPVPTVLNMNASNKITKHSTQTNAPLINEMNAADNNKEKSDVAGIQEFIDSIIETNNLDKPLNQHVVADLENTEKFIETSLYKSSNIFKKDNGNEESSVVIEEIIDEDADKNSTTEKDTKRDHFKDGINAKNNLNENLQVKEHKDAETSVKVITDNHNKANFQENHNTLTYDKKLTETTNLEKEKQEANINSEDEKLESKVLSEDTELSNNKGSSLYPKIDHLITTESDRKENDDKMNKDSTTEIKSDLTENAVNNQQSSEKLHFYNETELSIDLLKHAPKNDVTDAPNFIIENDSVNDDVLSHKAKDDSNGLNEEQQKDIKSKDSLSNNDNVKEDIEKIKASDATEDTIINSKKSDDTLNDYKESNAKLNDASDINTKSGKSKLDRVHTVVEDEVIKEQKYILGKKDEEEIEKLLQQKKTDPTDNHSSKNVIIMNNHVSEDTADKDSKSSTMRIAESKLKEEDKINEKNIKTVGDSVLQSAPIGLLTSEPIDVIKAEVKNLNKGFDSAALHKEIMAASNAAYDSSDDNPESDKELIGYGKTLDLLAGQIGDSHEVSLNIDAKVKTVTNKNETETDNDLEKATHVIHEDADGDSKNQQLIKKVDASENADVDSKVREDQFNNPSELIVSEKDKTQDGQAEITEESHISHDAVMEVSDIAYKDESLVVESGKKADSQDNHDVIVKSDSMKDNTDSEMKEEQSKEQEQKKLIDSDINKPLHDLLEMNEDFGNAKTVENSMKRDVKSEETNKDIDDNELNKTSNLSKKLDKTINFEHSTNTADRSDENNIAEKDGRKLHSTSEADELKLNSNEIDNNHSKASLIRFDNTDNVTNLKSNEDEIKLNQNENQINSSNNTGVNKALKEIDKDNTSTKVERIVASMGTKDNNIERNVLKSNSHGNIIESPLLKEDSKSIGKEEAEKDIKENKNVLHEVEQVEKKETKQNIEKGINEIKDVVDDTKQNYIEKDISKTGIKTASKDVSLGNNQTGEDMMPDSNKVELEVIEKQIITEEEDAADKKKNQDANDGNNLNVINTTKKVNENSNKAFTDVKTKETPQKLETVKVNTKQQELGQSSIQNKEMQESKDELEQPEDITTEAEKNESHDILNDDITVDKVIEEQKVVDNIISVSSENADSKMLNEMKEDNTEKQPSNEQLAQPDEITKESQKNDIAESITAGKQNEEQKKDGNEKDFPSGKTIDLAAHTEKPSPNDEFLENNFSKSDIKDEIKTDGKSTDNSLKDTSHKMEILNSAPKVTSGSLIDDTQSESIDPHIQITTKSEDAGKISSSAQKEEAKLQNNAITFIDESTKGDPKEDIIDLLNDDSKSEGEANESLKTDNNIKANNIADPILNIQVIKSKDAGVSQSTSLNNKEDQMPASHDTTRNNTIKENKENLKVAPENQSKAELESITEKQNANAILNAEAIEIAKPKNDNDGIKSTDPNLIRSFDCNDKVVIVQTTSLANKGENKPLADDIPKNDTTIKKKQNVMSNEVHGNAPEAQGEKEKSNDGPNINHFSPEQQRTFAQLKSKSEEIETQLRNSLKEIESFASEQLQEPFFLHEQTSGANTRTINNNPIARVVQIAAGTTRTSAANIELLQTAAASMGRARRTEEGLPEVQEASTNKPLFVNVDNLSGDLTSVLGVVNPEDMKDGRLPVTLQLCQDGNMADGDGAPGQVFVIIQVLRQ